MNFITLRALLGTLLLALGTASFAAIDTYAFETAMATALRWLDPTWGEDAYKFQVATPIEFIEAETVEA